MLKFIHKEERGFTLIELLVVVVILGVLATMAIPRVLGAIDSARESKAVADIRVIVSALERYYFDNGHYPHNLMELTDGKYLKSDFNFQNSHRDLYFYAVKYNVAVGGVVQPDHMKEFVLGDPSNPPGGFTGVQPAGAGDIQWWWNGEGATPPLPAGSQALMGFVLVGDPPVRHAVRGYWWGNTAGWTATLGPEPGDDYEIDAKPTRPDLQYD